MRWPGYSPQGATVARFLDFDGLVSGEQRTLAGNVSLLGTSPDGTLLALRVVSSQDGKASSDVTVVTSEDQAEVRRWSVPETTGFGMFANAGTAFCTQANLSQASSGQELICHDIATGNVILKRAFPHAGFGRIYATADTILAPDEIVLRLPDEMDGDCIYCRRSMDLTDFQTGKRIAHWRVEEVRTSPRGQRTFFESTISPAGDAVAIGGAGKLKIYRVARRRPR